MSGSSDISLPPTSILNYCPKCGARYQSTVAICPHCTMEMPPVQASITQQIDRLPTTIPLLGGFRNTLDPTHQVLLQFLPSGLCIPVTLDHPVILGRLTPPGHILPDQLIDLSHLDAEKRGVSRRHCQLERQGAHVFVSDLSSTNGTYLNGALLVPHTPYRLADGDRLILSRLHMTISFVPQPDPHNT